MVKYKSYSVLLLGFQSLFYSFFTLAYVVLVCSSIVRKLPYINKRVFAFILFFLITILLSVYLNTILPSYVYASTTDIEFRSLLTLGRYYSNGSLNIYFLIRFVIFFVVFTYFIESYKNKSLDEFIRVLNHLLYLIFTIQLLLIIVSEFIPVEAIRYLIDTNISQVGNFLTSDSYGLRFSAGFGEPSMMSVFLGALISIRINYYKIFSLEFVTSLLILFFFFATSRSAAILVVVLMCVILLHKNIYLKYIVVFAAILVLYLVMLNFDIIRQFDSVNLLRSAGERLHVPQFEGGYFKLFFGFDFGKVYSFLPIYNQILSIGLLNTILLVYLYFWSISKLLLFLIIFFITPQFWYITPWMSLMFLVSYINIRQSKYHLHSY